MERVVVVLVALIGVLSLYSGVTGFLKGESEVVLGRRHRKVVVFSGRAGDAIAVIDLFGGGVSLFGAVAFWTGHVSFPAVFLPAALLLALRQVLAWFLNGSGEGESVGSRARADEEGGDD
jgi:hypothetical protein